MAELSDRLRTAIIQCKIAPGTLIAENQLVHKYRSTKAKVRSALRKLVEEGFLESIPRMGHLVTLPTQKEVDEIFGLRGLLETWAAKEAASRISDEEIAYLRSLDFTVSSDNPESFHRSLLANRTFHLRIAEIAGNGLVTDLLSGLLDKVHRILHMGLITAVQAGELVDDHHALIDALAARDCRLAARIAKRQMQQARAMIEPAVGAYWREGNVGMPLRR